MCVKPAAYRLDSTPPSRDSARPTSNKVVSSQSFWLTSDSSVPSVLRWMAWSGQVARRTSATGVSAG